MYEVEDEIVESISRASRVISMAGMKLLENLNLHAVEESRRLAEGHREAARVMEQQQKAQHYAAQMIIKPALSEAWCQRAVDRDLANIFVFAEVWRERDVIAEVAYANLVAEINRRGVDLTEFADGNITDNVLEIMPETTGITDKEQSEISQTMQLYKGVNIGQDLPDVARTNPSMFAITQVLSQEQKRQIADLAEVSGSDFAIKTFENYLSSDQRAKMLAWEEIARAELEKTDAKKERANAGSLRAVYGSSGLDGASAVIADAKASRIEAHGESRESFAEQELMGYGQFRDVPGEISDSQLNKLDVEASNARKISRVGRMEALTTALKTAQVRANRGKASVVYQGAEQERSRES